MHAPIPATPTTTARRPASLAALAAPLLTRLVGAWPSQCQVCHAWPAAPVCNGCAVRFAQPVSRCRRCALPVPVNVPVCGACITHPPPLDDCLTAVTYAFPWSQLIMRFKFHDEPALAASLALLLRSTPWVEPALEGADLVLPMPISIQRLKERGYNQATLLAKQLAHHKLHTDILLRVRHTAPQSLHDRAARMRNAQGAFAVEPSHSAALNGARVVIVDDVMTSGASLFACAALLRSHGAAHITAMVVARTE